MTQSALVSLGYEGRNVEDLVAQLLDESVTVLVDVRLTPLSRKPGMSKRSLAAALAQVGIRYVHLGALGNPKDNRASFRAGDPRSRSRFLRSLETAEATEALRHVAELLDGETVALLCFEREHGACHRHLVAEALQLKDPRVGLVEV